MSTFIASGPLNVTDHSGILLERSELIKISEHIEKQDSYVILKSPRQTGKTTLLYQISRELEKKDHSIVYLSLGSYNNLEEKAFYNRIRKQIFDQVKGSIEENKRSKTPNDVDGHIQFTDFLLYLSEHISKKKKRIFLLDEIGGIPGDISLPLFSALRDLFTLGREGTQESVFYKKIMFVFSGALDVERLTQGKNSPLYNICKTFSLEDFSLTEVNKLAKNLKDSSPENQEIKDISPEKREIIAKNVFKWSAGHPYFTQRIFQLIEEKEIHKKEDLKEQFPKIVEKQVEEIIFSGDDANLSHIFNHLKENDPQHPNYKEYKKQAYFLYSNGSIQKGPIENQLLTLGIAKQEEDHLVIRNKIYKKALENFFPKKEEKGIKNNFGKYPIIWIIYGASTIFFLFLTLYYYLNKT